MDWMLRRSGLQGTLAIPPSKSHTIRALLVAALAKGRSTIRGPLLEGDGQSAIAAARCLGARIDESGSDLLVTGLESYDGGVERIDAGNSGTTTRLFCAAAALGSRPRRFDGDASLRTRTMRSLLGALADLGAHYTIESTTGDIPFVIRGPLRGGVTRVDGITSQFTSSLLFCCPLAPSATCFTVANLHEVPYVRLTLWWLDNMGINYRVSDDLHSFEIPGNQSYRPIDLAVPADFSSATFPAVAAAITGSSITLTGLDFSDPQGDKGVFDLLASMGADIDHGDVGVSVSCRGGLTGRDIDLNSMPDALPAFAVLGCAAQGVTRLLNVGQARIKETDRIAVMARELRAMGADIAELPDGLVIRPSRLNGARVNGHGDHRVVMALALAGMIADGETTISGAEAAEVTYPGFARDLRSAGALLELSHE